MDDVLRVIGGVELFALTLGFWAFTMLFHVLSDWRESTMGKHFMSFMVACDLVLGWSWLGFTFEISPVVRTWVRVVLYGGLAFIVWRQVHLLIRMQVIARSKLPDLSSTKENTDGQSA